MHTFNKLASSEGIKNTPPRVESLIAWVRSIVVFFESGKSGDIIHLRDVLRPFNRINYWCTLKRDLSRLYSIELFEKLERYKYQIHGIVHPLDAANDSRYDHSTTVQTLGISKSQSKPKKEGLENICCEDDILMLYQTHSPGLKGELAIDDIRGQRSILIGDATTRDEYEVRLEEYRSDYSLFIKDFCSWMYRITL